jgi:hypothetical protein
VGSDSWLGSEMIPLMVWNLIGKKDELFRLRCTKQFKLLSKKMILHFMPDVIKRRHEPFWVTCLAEMNKLDGSIDEKEKTLPYFKGYLFSTDMMITLQLIFYEVVAQPH